MQVYPVMRIFGLFLLCALGAPLVLLAAESAYDPTFFKLSVERTGVPPGDSVGFTVVYTNNAGVPKAVQSDVSVQIVSATQRRQEGDGTVVDVPVDGAALVITSSEPGEMRGTVTLPPVPNAAVTIQATLVARDGYNTELQTLTRQQTIRTLGGPSPTPPPLPSPRPTPPAPERTLPTLTTAVTIAATAAMAIAVGANLWPLLRELPNFFAFLFSGRRRKERWGLVVDSDLGKPIARAIVQVFDAQYHKLRETQVTGKDGQFGFLIPPGSYYLLVQRAGFQFPGTRQPPITLQKGESFYFGGELTIQTDDPKQIPRLIAPMDREEEVSAASIAFRRVAERVLAFVDTVSLPLMLFGAGLNTVFFVKYPSALSTFFEVLYVMLFILKLYLILTRQKGIGSVTDAETGAPVDLAAIRLYDAATNRIVQTRVTNTSGRFFILVPKGQYTVAVAKVGYETHLEQDVTISGRQAKALGFDFQLRKKAPGASPPPPPTAPSPPLGAPPPGPRVSSTLQNVPPPPPASPLPASPPAPGSGTASP